MEPGRFRDDSAGRVIRVGQGEAAYWAFVPDALPPGLRLDTQLVLTLSDADRALGELAGLARTAPNPNLLIRPWLRVSCGRLMAARDTRRSSRPKRSSLLCPTSLRE